MPLSQNERLSVSESVLTCFDEDWIAIGRLISLLGKKGVNLLPDLQARALTWQPFLDRGLSIPWWNQQLSLMFNTGEPPV